jgi:signal transduction histidine kinase
MLLGRLRIRGKLAVLGAIPLLAVGGLTVPLVFDQIQLADRAGGTVGAVRAASGVGSLVQEVQQERLLATGYLVGVADQADLAEQAARVTDRITDVREELGGELSTETSAAVDALGNLVGIRAQLLARRLTPEQAVAAYNPMIARLITSLHLGERQDLSAPGGGEVVALDAALRLGEQINISAAYIVIAAATRSVSAGVQLSATLATIQAFDQRVQIYATPEQAALSTLLQQSFDLRAGGNFITGYPVDPADPVATAASQTAPKLFPSLLSFITLGRFMERKIAVEATTSVIDQQRQALAFAYGAAALSLLVVLLVVLLSIAVARAVARPLTRLTRSVESVARTTGQELERVADDESETPAPIHLAPVDVQARDEIGELARAFEGVQQTAARLVERQVASRRNVAQMFGHVGRRTQNMVGRQITLIDQLEQGEEDPGRLQHLYRLDHLSSRLRRNAGSLVVLSGAAGGEPHVEPMRLGDVVRLALGEIEDYTRVDVAVPDDLVVVPALVGDVVLVLAELMENATNFSPPHTRVSVTAASSETSTGARLTIVDHGLGIPPDRLAEENARLGRRERLDLAPTEVLGLFVVGRLARRHGLGITLAETPGGGVTATVDLARHMLVPVRMPQPAEAYRALPAGRHQSWPLRVATLAGSDLPYDVAALDQAQRTLATGPTWNAFATERQSASLVQISTDNVPVLVGPAPATPPIARTVRATAPVEVRPVGDGHKPVPDPGPMPEGSQTPTTAGAEPARNSYPPVPALRQRVPGAQLPKDPSQHPARPAASAGSPEAARAVIEDFEAGVRRALNVASGNTMVDGTAAFPTADKPVSPAKAPLTRRVPGATLPPLTQSGGWPLVDNRPPPDPQQARDLVEQFEAGVLRALRDAGPDHRHEEEEPR